MVAVLCYGSLNPDIVHHLERFPRPGDDLPSGGWSLQPGGGAGNTALVVAGLGEEAYAVGNQVGDDPLGRWLLAELEAGGVSLPTGGSSPGAPTPHCVVLVTPEGERTIISTGYRGVVWQLVPQELWGRVDAVLVDGYSQQAGAEVAAEAAGRGLPVVGLDIGEGAPSCRLVVWSGHEHPPSEAERLAAEGVAVALTAGGEAFPVWWGGRRFQVRPPRVESPDPTGAGDAFAAACALGLARGLEPVELLRWAAAVAASVASRGRRQGVGGEDELARLAAQVEVDG